MTVGSACAGGASTARASCWQASGGGGSPAPPSTPPLRTWTTTGPFLEVDGGLTLWMCGRCQAARGQGPDRLEAAHHPGHPYLHWTCALCPYQVFWGRELEGHTALQHPGWTATFEILRPYPHQRLRVVYRRSDGPLPGA